MPFFFKFNDKISPVQTMLGQAWTLTGDIFFSFAQNKSSLLTFLLNKSFPFSLKSEIKKYKCLKILHCLRKFENLKLF